MTKMAGDAMYTCDGCGAEHLSRDDKPGDFLVTGADRVPWPEQWLDMARLMARQSTCASGRKVGAVFVLDKRVMAMGFNGVPAGFEHPTVCPRREQKVPSGQGLDLCVCAHAEANGIANAARAGVSLQGSTVYCTTQPCASCMGALANVGIHTVVFSESYPTTMTNVIASSANIMIFQYVAGRGYRRCIDGVPIEDSNFVQDTI